jgi:hypothetical protein
VKAERRRYQATIRETTIEFDGVKGQVANLRYRRGDEDWQRPKSMTDAIRWSLNRFKHIGRPDDLNLLLNIGIDHRGTKFEPVACFIVMGCRPLAGGDAEWSDEQALEMVEAFIGGQKTTKEVLDWLVERGGKVATIIEQARASRYEPDAVDFVCIWTRSNSVDEATRRMSRLARRDLQRRTVITRAARYRERGVRLKRMPSSRLVR